MEKLVPLHSLVIIVGDSQGHDVGIFPPHEMIDAGAIMIELVGSHRQELDTIVLREMRHRVLLKLSLGERVVVSGVPREQYAAFARLAQTQGAAVSFALTEDITGRLPDGEIIRFGQDIIIPALVHPSRSVESLREKWSGVTVIGDVHGDLQALRDALAWARSRRHFAWLLGDVLDYGPDSLASADLAYEVVMRGEGAFILGNHERKIARWLSQQEDAIETNLHLSDGNKVTLNALRALTTPDRARWVGRFRSLLGKATLFGNLGHITLTHAAVHPDFWTPHAPDEEAIEQYALYGETDLSSGAFALSYKWIDAIPAGKIVFVGHDERSRVPLNVVGGKGGRAIFMDTGAGKGGRLSSCDLRFGKGGLRIENFNVH